MKFQILVYYELCAAEEGDGWNDGDGARETAK